MDTIMTAFKLNKWEYKILDYIPLDDELNELGLKGWEMCGIHDVNRILYYFKRKCGELIGVDGKIGE